MMSSQPDRATDGLTQASRVIPLIKWSDGASLIVTRDVAPSKTSALPYLPAAVHVAPVIVPVLPCPEPSPTVVPEPSLNENAAIRLGLIAGVVTLAGLEFGPTLFAASRAATTYV